MNTLVQKVGVGALTIAVSSILFAAAASAHFDGFVVDDGCFDQSCNEFCPNDFNQESFFQDQSNVVCDDFGNCEEL